MNTNPAVVLHDASGTALWSGPLAEFVSSNDLDAGDVLSDLVAEHRAHGRSARVAFGGGSAPVFFLSLADISKR